MFMHWLFGMVYVFYFASFILLLREILRPGVLWFLRNLNDPDFNPIQEVSFYLNKRFQKFIDDLLTDDTFTNSETHSSILGFNDNIWNNCAFDDLVTNQNYQKSNAKVFAVHFYFYHVSSIQFFITKST